MITTTWGPVSHSWFDWSPPGESILTQWSQQGQPLLINTSAGRAAAVWFYCHRNTEWSRATLKKHISGVGPLTHSAASTHDRGGGNELISFFSNLIVSPSFLLFPARCERLPLSLYVSDNLPRSEKGGWSGGGTATNSNSAPAATLHSNRSFIPQLPYPLDLLSEEWKKPPSQQRIIKRLDKQRDKRGRFMSSEEDEEGMSGYKIEDDRYAAPTGWNLQDTLSVRVEKQVEERLHYPAH